MPEVAPVEPQRHDAGADALVNELISALDQQIEGDKRPIQIRLTNMRNMSRATSAEFEEFLQRFADLLNRSGRDKGISFTAASESADTEFDLLGTAYLIVADGFDTWELFLSLSPGGEGWAAWRAPWPVRVLRQPRPGHQQIFIPR